MVLVGRWYTLRMFLFYLLEVSYMVIGIICGKLGNELSCEFRKKVMDLVNI